MFPGEDLRALARQEQQKHEDKQCWEAQARLKADGAALETAARKAEQMKVNALVTISNAIKILISLAVGLFSAGCTDSLSFLKLVHCMFSIPKSTQTLCKQYGFRPLSDSRRCLLNSCILCGLILSAKVSEEGLARPCQDSGLLTSGERSGCPSSQPQASGAKGGKGI